MNILNPVHELFFKKPKMNIKEMDKFITKGIQLVEDHMSKTDYYSQQTLMKEISYLLFYTFEVLKDDFFNGDKVLEDSITQLDDYVFSQYKNKKELEKNLQYLTIIACSNRFKSDPHENLLSYYVFLEENGFEIIKLYKDFYQLMKDSNKKQNSYFHYFSSTSSKEINLLDEKSETIMSPIHVKNKIEQYVMPLKKHSLK